MNGVKWDFDMKLDIVVFYKMIKFYVDTRRVKDFTWG